MKNFLNKHLLFRGQARLFSSPIFHHSSSSVMKHASLRHPIAPMDQQIFDLLLDVVEKRNLRVTLRVAGGWVRNMLMGLPAKDIDIALDGLDARGQVMTGEYFATQVTEYQAEHGLETHHVGVIHANPSQSKHIESATTHIFGHPVDFLHLRTETYAEGSRIPTIERGTIFEDASRRDFTLNALFYNLHTHMVEDYVTGIEDLDNRVLRCPLPAMQTFHDDPLRLLRGVRFMAQLALNIDDDIVCAGQTATVHAALLDKVSRERVGIEIGKSLSGPDPIRAIDTLVSLGLVPLVFRFSPNASATKAPLSPADLQPVQWNPIEWDSGRYAVTTVVGHTPQGEVRLSAVLAALYSPFLPEVVTDPRLPTSIIFGLKLPRRIYELSQQLLDSAFKLETALKDVTETNTTRILAAMAPAGRFVSATTPRILVYQAMKALKGTPLEQTIPIVCNLAAARLKRESLFAQQVAECIISDPHNIRGAAEWRSIIKGNELASQLGIPPKDTSKALEMLMCLQVEVPGIGPGEAVTQLMEMRSPMPK
eukprot:PhF_6_TR33706/c0_g1_i1/m.49459